MDFVNSCVVVPNPPDWSKQVRGKRIWPVRVSQALTGAESRALGPTAPWRQQSFTITTGESVEWQTLRAILENALRTGKACVPEWGRVYDPAMDHEAAWVSLVEHESIANTWVNSSLVVGKLYFYQKGPNDVVLDVGSGVTLTQSGYFTAMHATILLTVSSMESPLNWIRRVWMDEWTISGSRVWASGDYVFLWQECLDGLSRDVLINCGGSADASWQADIYGSGGSAASTATAVTTSAVLGYAAPPAAVRQSARNVGAGGVILYVIPNLTPRVKCRVRLHFAEIVSGFDGSTARRLMNVVVRGGSVRTWTNFEPYVAAVGYNKAVVLDCVMAPDYLGQIMIQCYGATSVAHAGINAIEIYQYPWEIKQLGSGSGVGLARWTGWVKGAYSRVSPVLFGKLSLTDRQALTDSVGSIEISVQEPVGSGSQAITGTCPAHVCEPREPRYEPGVNDAVWDGCAGEANYFPSDYVWSLNPGENPNNKIPPGSISCHVAIMEIEWDLFVQDNPGTYKRGSPRWIEVYDGQGGIGPEKKMARDKTDTDCDPRTGLGNVTNHLTNWTTLAIFYCKTA